jgi:hypothetical protein
MISTTASGCERKGEWLVFRRRTVDPARAARPTWAGSGKIASCSVTM